MSREDDDQFGNDDTQFHWYRSVRVLGLLCVLSWLITILLFLTSSFVEMNYYFGWTIFLGSMLSGSAFCVAAFLVWFLRSEKKALEVMRSKPAKEINKFVQLEPKQIESLGRNDAERHFTLAKRAEARLKFWIPIYCIAGVGLIIFGIAVLRDFSFAGAGSSAIIISYAIYRRGMNAINSQVELLKKRVN